MNNSELLNKAKTAMEKSYSPYSKIKVGAALLCSDGSIYLGCNIENAAFSPTCCAERVAFFKAISDGKRNFSAVAVYSDHPDSEKHGFPPCGVCRQVMSEFCGSDFKIVLQSGDGAVSYTLDSLLPQSFGLNW